MSEYLWRLPTLLSVLLSVPSTIGVYAALPAELRTSPDKVWQALIQMEADDAA